jgi:hypothetical protein
MSNGRKYSKLFAALCLIGFLLGLFYGVDDRTGRTPAECRQEAILGFTFFVIACSLGGLLEKGMMGLASAMRRTVDPQASPVLPKRYFWLIAKYFGWFTFSVGCGIAISSLWLGSLAAWQAFAMILASFGLILGTRLASRLLGIKMKNIQ